MKKILLALILIAACLVPATNAFAHVLVMDETNTHGAVLHIIPDDDPIAGQPSDLYFDMQDALANDASVSLSVKSADGTSDGIEVNRNGSLVTAEYTFPTQGVYELTYTVASEGKEYVFKQTQRVSRGVASGIATQQTHAWAQGLLVTSLFGLAVVAILAFNRRKEIAKQSTF